MSNIFIECVIDDECVDDFLALLRRFQYDGDIGHNETISIFCDGDWAFRPKFYILDREKDYIFQGMKYLEHFEKSDRLNIIKKENPNGEQSKQE